MASELEDATRRFYHFYEQYFTAKQRNAGKEVSFFALMSLSQIHQIAGAPGPVKGREVMHKLFAAVLNQQRTDEMYDELRKDSGIQ